MKFSNRKVFIAFLYYNKIFDKFHFVSPILNFFNIYLFTNNKKSKFCNCGNKYFEFSAYQDINLYAHSRNFDKIIFINDTFLFSHFTPVNLFLLIIFYIKIMKCSDKSFIGIYNNKNFLNEESNSFYFSTWLFGISSDKNYQCINFEDSLKEYILKAKNNDKFIIKVNNWLLPKYLFKGWYKKDTLSSVVYSRKLMTIYLEMNLTLNLLKNNYRVMDLSFLEICLIKLDNYFHKCMKLFFIIYK